MKKIGIYKITNPKGAVYIGQSIDIDGRWNRYKSLRCKEQPKLYNSFNFYGVESHTFEILKECEPHELNYYERHFQEYYDVLSEYGLNLRLTGIDGKSTIISEETRKKIGGKSKGNKNFLGKKHSEETINKMRKPKPKGFADKISKVKKGCSLSINTKEKISESHLLFYKNGGENPAWKKVINTQTNETFNSCKQCWEANKDFLGVAYPTFKERLNGRKKNNTIFKYID